MRRGIALFLFGMLFGIIGYHLIATAFIAPAIMPVFSPGADHEIIGLIDGAERSIDIEMYVFTSRDVVEALERAKARGVDIRVIIERSTISGSNAEMFDELAAKGINVRYASSSYKLTHSKFMIIDGEKVLVGSHNFSNSALQYNREASVIFSGSEAVSEFIQAFRTDWALAG